MLIYQRGGLEDVMLERWWERLVLSGEMQKAYTGIETLSSLFFALAPPTVVVYEKREEDIWFLMWMEPWGSAGIVHIWIAPDMRTTKRALAAVLEALGCFFNARELLLAFTALEDVALEHEKIGFVRLGVLPLDREPTYINYLTKDAFTRETARFQTMTEH